MFSAEFETLTDFFSKAFLLKTTQPLTTVPKTINKNIEIPTNP
jgi:hypothetical protein